MKVKEITFTALMAAVCCILGPLSIPIGTVPISLTVVSVYLCVFALGTKFGTIAYVIYLLLGAAGLPVFSQFQGGVSKLVGPTGGYLIGFVIMAVITGLFIDMASHFSGAKKYLLQVVGMVFGFLPFDALKIAFCVVIGNALRLALTRAHLISYAKAK